MTKKQRTILLAILAIAGVLVIAVVGTGIWILRSLVENVSMNEAAATGPSMTFGRASVG